MAVWSGNAMPAAVSTGVVMPMVMVHKVKERAYVILPMVPDCERMSSMEIIVAFRAAGDGMMKLLLLVTLSEAEEEDGRPSIVAKNSDARMIVL